MQELNEYESSRSTPALAKFFAVTDVSLGFGGTSANDPKWPESDNG
jgi:hypothetical protein